MHRLGLLEAASQEAGGAALSLSSLMDTWIITDVTSYEIGPKVIGMSHTRRIPRRFVSKRI
jgi:hypothetical protein